MYAVKKKQLSPDVCKFHALSDLEAAAQLKVTAAAALRIEAAQHTDHQDNIKGNYWNDDLYRLVHSMQVLIVVNVYSVKIKMEIPGSIIATITSFDSRDIFPLTSHIDAISPFSFSKVEMSLIFLSFPVKIELDLLFRGVFAAKKNKTAFWKLTIALLPSELI